MNQFTSFGCSLCIHLIGARRDKLHVGSHFLELGQMRRAAEHRFVQRVLDVFVGGTGAAASVCPAMGYDPSLVNVKLVRRGHMSVGVL